MIELSPFQIRVFQTPEECDLLLLGGKASGKTHLVGPLVLRHAEQWRAHCRALYVRQTYGGARETEADLLDLFGQVFGRGCRYNGQEKLFKLPHGATFQLDQLSDASDLRKAWGKSFSLIIVDEVGEYPDLSLIDKLRPSLRPPLGVTGRMVLIGNPGGPSHASLVKRYIAGTTPWVPRIDKLTGRHFIWCPSTYKDSAHIDQAAYRRQLEAACAGDPALLAAWSDGSFAVAKGAFFGSVLDEQRNATDPWDRVPTMWPTFAAHDWGAAAPSVTLLFAESTGETGPDGRFYPRGSLVVLDEVSTNEPGSWTKGMGYSVPRVAEEVKEMCKFWKVRSDGVGDDSMFAKANGATSIADEFRREGVHLWPARKADRATGWTRMRRLLGDAGKPDVPGLYVSRRCEGWWSTVPFLGRDPRRIEDVDTRAADHWADATRYGCLRQAHVTKQYDMYATY